MESSIESMLWPCSMNTQEQVRDEEKLTRIRYEMDARYSLKGVVPYNHILTSSPHVTH